MVPICFVDLLHKKLLILALINYFMCDVNMYNFLRNY